MTEIWKDIKGFEGKYQVSNLGRVKNLERKVKSKYGYRTVKERILKQSANSRNDLIVCLGLKKSKTVHILVAQAFPEICGEWFENCDVHHKDFNHFNNNANNIKILTKTEHHLIHDNEENRIEKIRTSKEKPVIQYTLDGEFVKEWSSATKAANELGLSQSTIWECLREYTFISDGYICKHRTAGGYIWKYKEVA